MQETKVNNLIALQYMKWLSDELLVFFDCMSTNDDFIELTLEMAENLDTTPQAAAEHLWPITQHLRERANQAASQYLDDHFKEITRD